jgi:hypothetical protein
MRDILKEGFEAGAKGLRDFGYPDVTASMIEEAHGRWQRGEEPEGVIQMFAFKNFDDYPSIFGRPDA